MINQLLLAGSSIFIYEFLRYIKLINILKSNLKIYQKLLRLFKFKKVSDFRKEKLIFNYSKTLFLTSIKIFIILISLLIIIFMINFISGSFLKFIFSIIGIVEFSLFITIYHFMRKKINAKL